LMHIWAVWALCWAALVARVAYRAVGPAVDKRRLVEFRRFQEAFQRPSPPGSASPGPLPASPEGRSPCGRQFKSVRVLADHPRAKERAA